MIIPRYLTITPPRVLRARPWRLRLFQKKNLCLIHSVKRTKGRNADYRRSSQTSRRNTKTGERCYLFFFRRTKHSRRNVSKRCVKVALCRKRRICQPTSISGVGRQRNTSSLTVGLNSAPSRSFRVSLHRKARQGRNEWTSSLKH